MDEKQILAGYSPDEEKPVLSYAVLMSVFSGLAGEFGGEGGPGEVDERARGHGLRHAIGELLICPYCLGMWTSALFTAGLRVLPRFTRWVASVLVAFFGSETLQIAYKKAEQRL